MLVIGLLGVSVSVYVNFVFALLMIVIIGSSSSFGESVLLGYQRRYPAEMVGGWSSGTGMAGIAGSLLYILFNAVLIFSNQETFLCLLPTAIIYLMSYGLVLQEPIPPKPKIEGVSVNSQDDVVVSENESETQELLLKRVPGQSSSQTLLETKRQRYWRCTKLVLWQATNLMLVYFFEYVASVGAADRSEHPGFQHSTNWFVRNSYVLLAFCYQIGVFLSRSSLQVVRIKRVEILTLLQAGNFVLWMLQAQYKMMPIEAQLPLMFYVGLLGGASYVNVFYNLLHDDDYPEEDRELIINIAALFINVGIMLASAFSLVMAETAWKNL